MFTAGIPNRSRSPYLTPHQHRVAGPAHPFSRLNQDSHPCSTVASLIAFLPSGIVSSLGLESHRHWTLRRPLHARDRCAPPAHVFAYAAWPFASHRGSTMSAAVRTITSDQISSCGESLVHIFKRLLSSTRARRTTSFGNYQFRKRHSTGSYSAGQMGTLSLARTFAHLLAHPFAHLLAHPFAHSLTDFRRLTESAWQERRPWAREAPSPTPP